MFSQLQESVLNFAGFIAIDIKLFNIEYYDIQYAADKTICYVSRVVSDENGL